MYIIRNQKNLFTLSNKKVGQCFAKMLPATIVIDGEEKQGKIVKENKNFLISEIDGLSIKDGFEFKTKNTVVVKRKITNTTDKRIRFKSIFEIESCFKASHYVFPGFNYNGNNYGGSNTPTGLSRDGSPWVFAYDREGIPSCTVSEDKKHGLALFASDIDEDSLRSACSMIQDEKGYMRQRIFHPVSEMPYTYGGKNRMLDPYEEYMHLVPGGVKYLTMFIFVCVPEYENYATASLMFECDKLFAFNKEACLSHKRVWDLGISFFKFLTTEYKGVPMLHGHYSDKLFVMCHAATMVGKKMAIAMEDPANTCLSSFSTRFEIGWADQGAMTARLIALDGFKNNNQENINQGMKTLDAYVSTQWENGLLHPFYSANFNPDETKRQLPDACNMGWAMCEMVRSYHLFKDHGIDKPEYLEFSKKLGDFAVKAYSNEYGFGKSWNKDGSPRKTDGGAGGFMIMGLTELYKTVKKKAYLDTAIKAMNFYYKRDLDEFVCTAGALDCLCTDKETAYPFVRAALDLYEITKKPLWLERAEKACAYFFSWMFWYDAIYPIDAEFSKYGYYTTGGTLISAEHSALDPWGALLVYDLFKLYHLTGKENYRKWAKMTWCNALLGITSEEGMSVHGNVRPLGSQNEGFFHARWTKYRPTCEERGHFNDNLQTWMGAWRLHTISSLSKEDLEYLG